MPTYSFRCGVCGGMKDEVRPVSASGQPGPRCCRRAMVREFSAPQVRGDQYRAPRLVSQLQSLDGDPMKDPPMFESRSEETRYLKEHNRVFGTKFEY